MARYTPHRELVWFETFGGSGGRFEFDGTGNVYISGFFSDSQVQFGSLPPVINKGDMDAFVAKIDQTDLNNVHFGWVRSFGGPGTDTARDIALDDRGSIYVSLCLR